MSLPRRRQDAAFFDNAQPVASVAFVYPGEADPEALCEDETRLRQEVILAFLRFISARGNAKKIGARVALLAFLTGQSNCRTQRALAKRLGLSTGRISQMLNIAKRDLPMLAGQK